MGARTNKFVSPCHASRAVGMTVISNTACIRLLQAYRYEYCQVLTFLQTTCKVNEYFLYFLRLSGNKSKDDTINAVFLVLFGHYCYFYSSHNFTSSHLLYSMVNFQSKFIVIFVLILCKYLEFRLICPWLTIRLMNMHWGLILYCNE